MLYKRLLLHNNVPFAFSFCISEYKLTISVDSGSVLVINQHSLIISLGWLSHWPSNFISWFMYWLVNIRNKGTIVTTLSNYYSDTRRPNKLSSEQQNLLPRWLVYYPEVCDQCYVRRNNSDDRNYIQYDQCQYT